MSKGTLIAGAFTAAILGILGGTALTSVASAPPSVARGRYAEAREALERAETRLLGDPAGNPDVQHAILNVRAARAARDKISRRDRRGVQLAIDDAMTAATRATYQAPPSAPAPAAAGATSPPSPPPITYALLPGHWKLDGWRYVWVPPETVLRRVEERSLVPGHFVWRGGRWVWVPTSYGLD